MQPINTQDIQEPKRWVLGPNLDTFFFVFWSTINNEWVSEWTETNSVPSRLKFELAFKRADGEAARIEEIQKREIIVFSESITQAMQNPPLPQARGGSGREGSRGSSGKKPTPEQIAAWRKKQAERSGRDGKDGRSRYTEAQKAEWAKRMRERANSKGRSSGKGGGGGSSAGGGPGSGAGSNAGGGPGSGTGSNAGGGPGSGTGRGPTPNNGWESGNATIPGYTTINDAILDYAAMNEDNSPSSVNDLVPDYLTSVPNPPSGNVWVIKDDGSLGYQPL
jgi:hypothetical protein